MSDSDEDLRARDLVRKRAVPKRETLGHVLIAAVYHRMARRPVGSTARLFKKFPIDDPFSIPDELELAKARARRPVYAAGRFVRLRDKDKPVTPQESEAPRPKPLREAKPETTHSPTGQRTARAPKEPNWDKLPNADEIPTGVPTALLEAMAKKAEARARAIERGEDPDANPLFPSTLPKSAKKAQASRGAPQRGPSGNAAAPNQASRPGGGGRSPAGRLRMGGPRHTDGRNQPVKKIPMRPGYTPAESTAPSGPPPRSSTTRGVPRRQPEKPPEGPPPGTVRGQAPNMSTDGKLKRMPDAQELPTGIPAALVDAMAARYEKRQREGKTLKTVQPAATAQPARPKYRRPEPEKAPLPPEALERGIAPNMNASGKLKRAPDAAEMPKGIPSALLEAFAKKFEQESAPAKPRRPAPKREAKREARPEASATAPPQQRPAMSKGPPPRTAPGPRPFRAPEKPKAPLPPEAHERGIAPNMTKSGKLKPLPSATDLPPGIPAALVEAFAKKHEAEAAPPRARPRPKPQRVVSKNKTPEMVSSASATRALETPAHEPRQLPPRPPVKRAPPVKAAGPTLEELEARDFDSLSDEHKTRLMVLRRQSQNTGFKPGYRTQRPEAPNPDEEAAEQPIDRSPRGGGGAGLNDILGGGQTRVKLGRRPKKAASFFEPEVETVAPTRPSGPSFFEAEEQAAAPPPPPPEPEPEPEPDRSQSAPPAPPEPSSDDELAALEAQDFMSLSNDDKTRLIMLRRQKQNTGFKPGQRVQRPEAPDPDEEPEAPIDRSPRRGAGGGGGGINDIFSSGQTRVRVGRAKKSTSSFFEPEITEVTPSESDEQAAAEHAAERARAAAEQAAAEAAEAARIQAEQEAAEQAQREAEELAAAQARLQAAQQAEAAARAEAERKAAQSASTEDELAALEARPFAGLSNDEKTRLIMLRRQKQNTGFKPGQRVQRPEAPDPDEEPAAPVDRSPRRGAGGGGGGGMNDLFGAGQTRVRLGRPKKKTD